MAPVITVCPMAIIAAPVEAIWPFLADATRIPLWADAQLDGEPPAIEPGATLRLSTRAFGRKWPVIFNIGEVVPMKRLAIDVHLPFGVVNHEVITLSPVDQGVLVAFN